MLVSFELLETQTRFEGLRAVEGTLVLLATAVRISLHQVNQVFIVGQGSSLRLSVCASFLLRVYFALRLELALV